jgi:hypothetical protein
VPGYIKRTDLDDLLSRGGGGCSVTATETQSFDGRYHISANRPYVCNNVDLLKWKYLDTVTIDVELLALRPQDDDEILQDGIRFKIQNVDMTRYILLTQRTNAPRSRPLWRRVEEYPRRFQTGEWYYLAARTDKIAPNHINTARDTAGACGESDGGGALPCSVPAGSEILTERMRRMLRSAIGSPKKHRSSSTSSFGKC